MSHGPWLRVADPLELALLEVELVLPELDAVEPELLVEPELPLEPELLLELELPPAWSRIVPVVTVGLVLWGDKVSVFPETQYA
jgi:hypothetical protein